MSPPPRCHFAARFLPGGLVVGNPVLCRSRNRLPRLPLPAVVGEQQVLGQVRRAYATAETNKTVGRILLGVGAVMMTIGFFMIQKITDIEV